MYTGFWESLGDSHSQVVIPDIPHGNDWTVELPNCGAKLPREHRNYISWGPQNKALALMWKPSHLPREAPQKSEKLWGKVWICLDRPCVSDSATDPCEVRRCVQQDLHSAMDPNVLPLPPFLLASMGQVQRMG